MLHKWHSDLGSMKEAEPELVDGLAGLLSLRASSSESYSETSKRRRTHDMPKKT